jgi:DNA modification methylase
VVPSGANQSTGERGNRKTNGYNMEPADTPATTTTETETVPATPAPDLTAVPAAPADTPPVPRATCSIVASDVLEFLNAQPEQSVDMILGSPPYDSKARRYGTEKNLRGQDWVDWMVEVYRASLRVCRGLVAFVVDGSTRDYRWSCTPALLIADLHRAGVHLRKPVCYVRHGIPGSGGRDWLKNNWEMAICATTHGGALPWSDNTACGHPPIYKRSGPFTNRRSNGDRNRRPYTPPERANPGNVINCKVGGNQMGSKLAHENEAPFPELLAELFVRSFCPPGGLVCDPFLGSGTTAAVSMRWGRNFTGCDLRPGQVELARRRVNGEPSTPQPAPVRPIKATSGPKSRATVKRDREPGITLQANWVDTISDWTGDAEAPLEPLLAGRD